MEDVSEEYQIRGCRISASPDGNVMIRNRIDYLLSFFTPFWMMMPL